MKVYIFGNKDFEFDKEAFEIAEYISAKKDESINFIEVKPNEDVPFENEEHVVIMDAVAGIKEIKVLDENSIEKLIMAPRTSVHEFDLGFQLKYLKKLGKIKKVTIIGIPMEGNVDYDSIHSILRKLVAQDIHGS